MTDDDVYEVQRLYPQIFVACHVDHVRAVSIKWRVSSQDASILVHLDREFGLSPLALARHLGVASSTLSSSIGRLSKLGYLTSEPNEKDRRKREVRLTARGADAISATSILNADRVRAMLGKLTPDQRRAALCGLNLLAQAARQLKD